MDAAIVRPRNFTKGKSYPVILDVYAGPHSKQVIAQADRYMIDQWMADRGYIVVLIDGRGTPGHGREWERAIRGNLIDVALADQVAGLQALAKQEPAMDLKRVGAVGWSFGGYFSAMAVMRKPDIFRCARGWRASGDLGKLRHLLHRALPRVAVGKCRRIPGQQRAHLRRRFTPAALAHSRAHRRQRLCPAFDAALRGALQRGEDVQLSCRCSARIW